MTSGTIPARVWLIGGVVGAIAVAVAVFGFIRLSQTPSTSQTANSGNPAHDTYAALYQAARRQDQGVGSVTMATTLFLPATVEALGSDTERSDIEDELYRIVKEVSDKQIAIFIATDSVQGPLSDNEITDTLTLASDPSSEFRLVDWQTLIAPHSATNSAVQVTPQTGVAIFERDSQVDYSQLQSLTLTSRGLAGIDERTFTWAIPALLQQVEAN